MIEPIENEYFNWLCAKVLDDDTQNYFPLMEILFRYEFVWVVPADRHRIDDVIEVKQNFYRETNTPRNSFLEGRFCSILELFIAFADRTSFQTDMPVKEWFWIFLTNLNLDRFSRISDSDIPLIEEILYTFTWRIYEPNGLGGLFPIPDTLRDQREIEIWYQFCEWVQDKGLI